MAILLGGCGFELRSNDAISAAIPSLRLDSAEPNSEFMRLLRNSLEAANVSLVSAPGPAPTLQLGPERLNRQPVSVNPRARAAQYELRLEIDFMLSGQDQALISQQTLYTERTLFEDIENISGNRDEVNLVASEMRRELVNQLLRRLEMSAPQ
ncbi:MAG: LPS assembly lipoprotein LptE [Gammaproteobacteria bacterium]